MKLGRWGTSPGPENQDSQCMLNQHQRFLLSMDDSVLAKAELTTHRERSLHAHHMREPYNKVAKSYAIQGQSAPRAAAAGQRSYHEFENTSLDP